MIEENEFYVSLSDIEMDNKSLKGDQQLPKNINLYTDWKIGLTELNVNSQFENFEDVHYYMRKKGTENWAVSTFKATSIDNIKTLIQSINYDCKQLFGIWKNLINIGYDEVTKIMNFDLKNDCEVIFPDIIYFCFGMGRGIIITQSFSMRYKGKFYLEPPAFILNCNLVEQSILNDTYEPYLKFFDLNEDWTTDDFKKFFIDIHYFKIKEKTFGIIKFELKQIRGFPVKFSKCILSGNLHFIRNT